MPDELEDEVEEPCVHVPDLTSMSLADVEQTPDEVIYDVDCLNCGKSGAFRLVASQLEVDW